MGLFLFFVHLDFVDFLVLPILSGCPNTQFWRISSFLEINGELELPK
jgi:hypothetical protein